MTIQKGLPVNLPQAATAQSELRQVVTLTLTKEGKLLFDKEEMTGAGQAAARLVRWKAMGSEVSVVINADRSVAHGDVVELMDAIRQSGVTRIAIAVQPRRP